MAASDDPIADPPTASFLTEPEWSRLLRAIHNNQVIPVIGPELVTVPDDSGGQIPLTRWLIPRLPKSLPKCTRKGKPARRRKRG